MGIGASFINSVDQIAIVVRDLDAAMAKHVALGIGPWDVYTYGEHRMPGRMTFRGNQQGYVMKIALAFIGPTMIELIQPIQGPSVYHEHLENHGEGLHHYAYGVPNIDDAIAEMEALGYAMFQSGRGFGLDGDGAYAYFDTEAALGYVIEAVEFPRQMPPPEEVVGAELAK